MTFTFLDFEWMVGLGTCTKSLLVRLNNCPLLFFFYIRKKNKSLLRCPWRMSEKTLLHKMQAITLITIKYIISMCLSLRSLLSATSKSKTFTWMYNHCSLCEPCLRVLGVKFPHGHTGELNFPRHIPFKRCLWVAARQARLPRWLQAACGAVVYGILLLCQFINAALWLSWDLGR